MMSQNFDETMQSFTRAYKSTSKSGNNSLALQRATLKEFFQRHLLVQNANGSYHKPVDGSDYMNTTY